MQQHAAAAEPRDDAASTVGLTGWPQSEFRKRKLEIKFTGSGSEYFRIWIVNLLLTIVTASLYWPFAKARRIRYFYANTLVDGHALSFHGDPWKMFRGHLLLLVLMGVYSAAGHFSPMAGLIAFGVMAVIWPALWRAGLQFRLGNTAWRGLRLGFTGTLKGAYVPFLPLWVMSGVILAAQAFAGPAGMEIDGKPRFGPVEQLVLAVVLLAAAATPWLIAAAKRYQHGGYRIAAQQGELKLRTASVYWLCVKTIGVGLLIAFGMGALMALGAGASIFLGKSQLAVMVTMFVAVGVSYLLFFALMGPFFTARFQDLVWNGTTTEDLSFTSQLRFGSLAWLTIKNWVLTALTIGLYRPFAVVHTSRMRLEAVSLTMDGDVETWMAGQTAANQDAAGEFAGDFFGIDMGL